MQIPFFIENTLDLSHPSLPMKGGIPIPEGRTQADGSFRVFDGAGRQVAAQVNVTGYWPDGSVKWVLVVMSAPVAARGRTQYSLEIEEQPAKPSPARIRAEARGASIHVNTGPLDLTVPTHGGDLFSAISLQLEGEHWHPVLADASQAGLFVEVLRGDPMRGERIRFEANADPDCTAVLEEAGSERAVIRVRGTHVSDSGERWGDYTLRLYAHAGSSQLRLVHSLIFTGDPQRDFVSAIGVRLQAGIEKLVAHSFGGARGTGLVTLHNEDENYPIWRRAVLSQDSAQHFCMKKWVDPEHNRAVTMGEGGRSQGWGSLLGREVRVTAGLRNFWQEHPKAIQVDTESRTLTAYIYSPYGEALDLRRYSDLVYGKLYETPSRMMPFFDQRAGARYIGKTSELFLDFATPEDQARSAREALFFQTPPVLTAGGAWIAETRALGDFATAAQAARAGAAAATERVREMSSFLRREQEYRSWYSFVDYGDIMHSFDPERDLWRQDEGGYAWLNNEFMMVEAMWHAYLHTDDVQLFHFAEAMTRHTSDVDMYHRGPLAGHGIRHNVNHWGCMDKERRMTVPLHKRIYYFLTGDEHTRDLVRFIYDTICEEPPRKEAMDLGVGGYATLFLWETTGDPAYGEILKNATETYCDARIGGKAFPNFLNFDFQTGRGGPLPEAGPHAGYFLLMFGPMLILLDSLPLTRSEKVRTALLEWADLLHLPQEELHAIQPYVPAGKASRALVMRVTSWAYQQTKDPRFREYLEYGLNHFIGRLERRGGPSLLDPEEHLVYRNDGRQTHHCEYIMPSIANVPFGIRAVEEERGEVKGER